MSSSETVFQPALPMEVLLEIATYLGPQTICRLEQTCTAVCRLVGNYSQIWREALLRLGNPSPENNWMNRHNAKTMYKRIYLYSNKSKCGVCQTHSICISIEPWCISSCECIIKRIVTQFEAEKYYRLSEAELKQFAVWSHHYQQPNSENLIPFLVYYAPDLILYLMRNFHESEDNVMLRIKYARDKYFNECRISRINWYKQELGCLGLDCKEVQGHSRYLRWIPQMLSRGSPMSLNEQNRIIDYLESVSNEHARNARRELIRGYLTTEISSSIGGSLADAMFQKLPPAYHTYIAGFDNSLDYKGKDQNQAVQDLAKRLVFEVITYSFSKQVLIEHLQFTIAPIMNLSPELLLNLETRISSTLCHSIRSSVSSKTPPSLPSPAHLSLQVRKLVEDTAFQFNLSQESTAKAHATFARLTAQIFWKYMKARFPFIYPFPRTTTIQALDYEDPVMSNLYQTYIGAGNIDCTSHLTICLAEVSGKVADRWIHLRNAAYLNTVIRKHIPNFTNILDFQSAGSKSRYTATLNIGRC